MTLPSKSSAARFDFQGRTHLTTIMGFAEMLADPTVELPREKALEYAEIIFACAEAMHREQRDLTAVWYYLPDE